MGVQKENSAHQRKIALKGTMLQGRQLAWIIQDHFRMTNTQGDLMEIKDLFDVKLINDNIEGYLNAFDHVLLRQSETRCDNMLENLFLTQIEQSMKLKELVSYYKCQNSFEVNGVQIL